MWKWFIWWARSIYEDNLNTVHKDILVEGVGSNIRSVNRIIKELVDEDIIEYNKGSIKVKDINKLADINFSSNSNNNLVSIFNNNSGGKQW